MEIERQATRLRLRLDRAAPRRWHVDLASTLAAIPGVTVEVEPTTTGSGLPASAALLFGLEACLRGRLPSGPAGTIALDAFAAYSVSAASADLTIDLCGDMPADPAVWRLTYGGLAGEAGLFTALLAGEAPLAALVRGGAPVALARLGSNVPEVVGIAFEDALDRTGTLVAGAVRDHLRGRLQAPPADLAVAFADLRARVAGPERVAAASGVLVAAAVSRRLQRLCLRLPHWRVGWRRVVGADVIDMQGHPPTGWHSLADDGLRFYADPFPILHEGHVTLFVEDYVHRTGRGAIAAVRVGPEGPVGRPEIVLEEPHHLSYPFVFARDGAVWMVPESGEAGTVDLYRATAFPGGWRKEATLVSGCAASDATLVEENGLWWMFATVRGGHGCPSDALHLWSAPDFRGPWTPHPGNPVLIDAAAARPAGRIVRRGGALIRPVQDCRHRYGGALGLARVLKLDHEGFAQVTEARLTPGGVWRGRHLHTLNRAGAFEFIDGTGYAPRIATPRLGRTAPASETASAIH